MVGAAARDNPQDSDPHQQHQPHPGRDLVRARRIAPPWSRGREGRNGDRAVTAWSREEFKQKLRDKGRTYHIHHPFNVMLNSEQTTPSKTTTRARIGSITRSASPSR